ncbi:MAG: hypothetical protein AAFQ94_09180 [Bacteroidota bacterium]
MSDLIPYLGPGDLEDAANNLSSFEGEYYDGEEDFEGEDLDDFDGEDFEEYDDDGLDSYIGDGDDMLDFDGEVENFSSETTNQKQFIIEITNSEPTSKTALLWGGYLSNNNSLAPGQIRTGAFNDKAGNAGLTATSNVEKTIEEFLAYLYLNPTRVVQMRVASSVASQIGNQFTIRELDPFKSGKTDYIRPQNYTNQNTFQDKTVLFPVDNFQFDDQNTLEYQFSGSSTTVITFYCGASLNGAKALRKKARRGIRNVNMRGRRRIYRRSINRKRRPSRGRRRYRRRRR